MNTVKVIEMWDKMDLGPKALKQWREIHKKHKCSIHWFKNVVA